jgi:hypothetical protein
MREGGLADARHVFNQQVSTSEQADHAVLGLGRFADDDRVKLVDE